MMIHTSVTCTCSNRMVIVVAASVIDNIYKKIMILLLYYLLLFIMNPRIDAVYPGFKYVVNAYVPHHRSISDFLKFYQHGRK